ncbi:MULTISPECIES: response regulator [Massilia]|uniref:response regulator n=1 Tax=Massilia TaxID=149698 RepID=UPI001C63A55C|nr:MULTISPECIES: response regulator [Massilia]QYG03217.1 response regulator [Massilia sp. NP310]
MAESTQILLVEPEPMLRRTVAMTARSLGLSQVHEAASIEAARRMLRARAFHGAVIAVDCVGRGGERRYDLSLVDELRAGGAANGTIPIAIMAEQATAELLHELRDRRISRGILKPFRAKVLLETIEQFGAAGKPRPGLPQRPA